MQGVHPSSPVLPVSSPTSSSSMPILASPAFLPTSMPAPSPAFLTHLIHTLTCPILAQHLSHCACTQECHLANSHSSLPGPCLHPHPTCTHMHTPCFHHSCHVHVRSQCTALLNWSLEGFQTLASACALHPTTHYLCPSISDVYWKF